MHSNKFKYPDTYFFEDIDTYLAKEIYSGISSGKEELDLKYEGIWEEEELLNNLKVSCNFHLIDNKSSKLNLYIRRF